MDTDYDPQREAEAALKLAVAADGPERQRLADLAMAWQELARMRCPRVPAVKATRRARSCTHKSNVGS